MKTAPQPWPAIAQRFCSTGNYFISLLKKKKPSIRWTSSQPSEPNSFNCVSNSCAIFSYYFVLIAKDTAITTTLYSYFFILKHLRYATIQRFANTGKCVHADVFSLFAHIGNHICGQVSGKPWAMSRDEPLAVPWHFRTEGGNTLWNCYGTDGGRFGHTVL